MKKVMIFIVSISSGLALYACPIVLENDTNTTLLVTDLVGNHPTELVERATTVQANKNPDVHADIRVQTASSKNKMAESYRIKQIACSPNPSIHIKATAILKSRLDPALFTIEKERMLTKRLAGE